MVKILRDPYWMTPDELDYGFINDLPLDWIEDNRNCPFYSEEKDCHLYQQLEILLNRFPRDKKHYNYIQENIPRMIRCERILNVAGYRLSLYEDSDPDLVVSLDETLKHKTENWEGLKNFKGAAIECRANYFRDLGPEFYSLHNIKNPSYLHRLTIFYNQIDDPYKNK